MDRDSLPKPLRGIVPPMLTPLADRDALDVPGLERLIEQYPEQWLWWHRRWRRRQGIDYRRNPKLVPDHNAYLAWLDSLTDVQPAPARRTTGG